MSDMKMQIYSRMNLRTTEELLEIWQENDRNGWTDEAFEVIREILLGRDEAIPEQKESIKEESFEESSILDRYREDEDQEVDSTDEPVFYKPERVRKTVKWLNIFSIVLVVVKIISDIPQIPIIQTMVSAYFPNTPEMSLLSSVIGFIIFVIIVILECAFWFFLLRFMGSILEILMSMEFNSRKPIPSTHEQQT